MLRALVPARAVLTVRETAVPELSDRGSSRTLVPFPATFKETLALHISAARDNGAAFLFESSQKKPYSTRGVRAMLARYAAKAPDWRTHAATPA